jgi:subtilase family protein/fervidolysin-like protein
MPIVDALRRLAARTARARPLRLRGAVGCAIVLSLGLALPAGDASARYRSSHSHNNDSDSSSDNGGQSSSAPSSVGSSTTSPVLGGSDSNSGGSGANSGGTNSINTTLGGNDRKLTGGSDSGFIGASPGSGLPHVGFGFNNNSASVQASFPIGSSAHLSPLPSEDHQRVTRPMLTIPLARNEGLSHALSYRDSGDTLSGVMGGSHALTTKLIHSVTSTLSNQFVNKLGHSLRAQPAEPGTGANSNSNTMSATTASGGASGPRTLVLNRNPSAVVRDRFAPLGDAAFEPRSFTVPMAGETRFVPNEVVVGVPSNLSAQQLDALARRNGLAHVDSQVLASSGMTLHRWRIADQRSVPDVIRALEADGNVQAAQPNYRFALAQQAGVSEAVADGFSVQYVPAKLHLRQAHGLTRGQDVLVAVIDTGIDRLHPEIAGAVAESFDAIGASEPPDSHGTGIAGAIVSHGRLMGAAPGARLLAIRAFSVTGTDAEATTLTIVRSIDWAMAHGARVINMSFAGARDPVIGKSLAAARRKGIVLIAAAGNAGPQSPPLYPAADPNVIAVSATDVDDNLLDVSNRGRHIALAAPGVDVLLPAPGARYQIATGTSFAAAHVAGIAALLLARNPHLTPDAVRSVLVASARDLGPKGRDDRFGAGLADAYKALVSLTADGPQTVASNAPPPP